MKKNPGKYRQLRNDLALSQPDFAKELDVPLEVIQAIEQEKASPVGELLKWLSLLRLANAGSKIIVVSSP